MTTTPSPITYKALILDTETTDKKPPLEVIELAWKEPQLGVRGGQRTLPEVYRFKPSEMPKWGALATHHILMSDLEGLPHSDTCTILLPLSEYLIGHNVDFDWKALGCPEGKRICTLAMSRDLWPEVDSHSLVAMMYWTQGANPTTRDMVRGAHSAGDDVQMTELLLNTIMEVAGIHTWEALWVYSEEARIPKIMTFGKFRGKPISAVDRGFMNWYRKQADPDKYVLEAFKRNGM